MAFPLVNIEGVIRTAIFIPFGRKEKRFRKRKTEIAGKYGRKVLLDGDCCIGKAKKKHRVPDTAHDCPILRIGVVYGQTVSETENL